MNQRNYILKGSNEKNNLENTDFTNKKIRLNR